MMAPKCWNELGLFATEAGADDTASADKILSEKIDIRFC